MKQVVLLFLFVLEVSSFTEVNYDDDDIGMPVPEVILNHSPTNVAAQKFLAYVNNCKCRHNPKTYIVCFGTPCKEFPASLNVTVPLFKLKLSSVTVIKRNDFVLLNQVLYLEIESNFKLVRIEPGCFRNMSQLQNLSISSNDKLRYLEPNVFEGLVNLTTICLQKNGFNNIVAVTRALSPMHLPNLYLLELNENVFHEIPANAFHSMNGTTVKELNMVICEIEYIHPDSLLPLKNLNSLRLGQNLFNSSVIANLVERSVELGIPLDSLNLYGIGFRKDIPTNLLNAIAKSNIRSLHLTENNFDEILDYAFPYMPNLVKLSMKANHISTIGPKAFVQLVNLKTLYLTVNRLLQVPEAAILSSLYELDLSGNTYSLYSSYFYIPEGIFQNMSTLQNLQLSYNNICYLIKSTFVGLENLARLNLKNTSLFFIENGTFLPLVNLQKLNLMKNPFPKYMPVTADLFLGLKNLKVLLLGGCSLRNLTTKPSLFSNTPNLIHLGLERNEIFTLSPEQFTSFKYLQSLNVAENKLSAWSKRILLNCTTLKNFCAYQNKITKITTAMLEDWSTLDSLYLDDNPFTCDCTLYPAVLWLKSKELSTKFYTENNLVATCVSPDVWRRKSIVAYMKGLNEDSSDCEEYQFFTTTITLLFVILFILLLLIVILLYIHRWYLQYWLLLFRLNLQKKGFYTANKVKKNPSDYRYDAFVSYCNEDRLFVMHMIQMLEKQEPYLRLCIYERDFQIGAIISEAVVESVASSKRTVLIASDAFAKSHWCRWETQLAEYHNVFFGNDSFRGPDDTLVIVKLEDVAKEHLTPVLKYLLKTRIYLQWDVDKDKQKLFWDKLRTTLASPKEGMKGNP